ncbi:MAG TPA: hypothetical protein VMC84_06895 [Methanocella sp.]|uniref:hypothetical protein n=1 Tax=Methanocella sp. TaxID=2052833 RepID=UPI002CEA8401|nr:hypothetical protein [Methanocella sp.]HTY90889.1 hypothetical protein [Methanocella sp.]
MRKLLLGLVAGATLATALILAGMYSYDNISLSTGDLTNKQKIDARNIALSDHLVAFFLDNPNATHSIGNIGRPGPDFYIRPDAARTIATVPVYIKNEYGTTNLTITVDLDNGRVLGQYFDERSPDITYKQQMNAIEVALNDHYVQNWMKDLATGSTANGSNIYFDGLTIRGVHMSGFNEYGYTDPFGFYVDVPLTIDSSIPPAVKYLTVTVNLADNTTAIRKESWGEGLMGSVVTATIPPCQSFFAHYYTPLGNLTLSHGLPASSIVFSTSISIDSQPDDIDIRPQVVDQENLARQRNGTTFSELAGARYHVVGNHWAIFIPQHTDFFLVLKNEDNRRAVNVTIPIRYF